MIGTLLVANRGEIACRVFNTARRLGIRTVAVYSDADVGARHVRLADEAHHIGGAPSADSYLNIDRIIDVARVCGAEAIHPGYGFLAENAAFARACAAADIAFVGPTPEAINAMAMKGAAKSIMEKAGVPVLPGLNEVSIENDLARIESEVGFPLLVKPAAGGGGKGMKVVASAAELEPALTSAAREAASSFGDDQLIVERYLARPRHVEVQVFADTHGNVVHLNERDCSLQRRHQKIIEEAPAPGMSAALRTEMGEAAVAAAKSIGYVGAGTVEFLVDGDAFYFMEMNTRLQVEHPVTELITGLDLVEWQLLVASGEQLPSQQDDISITGHAIEARVYAEDPENDFLPVAGRLDYVALPSSVRIDTGFDEGDQVSVFYDPMIMKVIAHGADREECLDALADALAETRIGGIKTNRDFLIRAADHPVLRDGRVWTSFLDDNPINAADSDEDVSRLVAAAVIALSCNEPIPNFRLNAPHQNRLRLYRELTPVDVLVGNDSHQWHIRTGDHSLVAGVTVHDDEYLLLDIDGTELEALVIEFGESLLITTPTQSLELQRGLPAAHQQEASGSLRSPMSGKVIEVRVSEGDTVNAGETLIVLEAMKMEHTITAASGGTVSALHCAEGDVVADGVELIAIEESA